MDTLYLNSSWDLCLDASANIALATEPYSLAQDAASACRTFLGEVYYDTSLGVPYFQQILGKNVPLELVRAQLVAQCLTVPGVVAAQVFFSSLTDRTLSGQIQVTNQAGVISATGISI